MTDETQPYDVAQADDDDQTSQQPVQAASVAARTSGKPSFSMSDLPDLRETLDPDASAEGPT
mgnify:FL=1